MVNLSKTATKFSVFYIKKDKLLIFRHKNHQQHTVHAPMTHSSLEKSKKKILFVFQGKKAFAIVYNCVVIVKKSNELFSLCHIPTTGCKVTIIIITNYYIQHTIILSTVLLNTTEFMTLCIIYFQETVLFQKVRANVQKSNGLSSVSETNNWAQNYNNITDYSIQLTA